MRIRLALLDEDPSYLARVQEHLATAHGGKIETVAFTDAEAALGSILEARTHVFLAHETFEIDPARIPPSCEFAYLADSPDVEAVRGVRALAKYSAVDDFYRSVTALYNAASASLQIRSQRTAGTGSVITFTSPAGGVGTTSVALAFARTLALQPTSAPTLYLSLNPWEDVSARFGLTDAAHGTFSDVVYAVKRRRGDLQLQLESLTYQDAYGTLFFASAVQATDVLELADDDLALLTEQLTLGGFNTVVDVPFSLAPATLRLLDSSTRVVLVSDGRQGSNAKVVRGAAALDIAAAQHDLSVLPHTGLLYNKFSSTLGIRIEAAPVPEIGGINRIEGASDDQVIDAVFSSGRLDPLLRTVTA